VAARATAQAAQSRVAVARGQALPSLVVSGTGSGTYFFRRPLATQQGNSYSATIGLQIPLFSGWSQIYDVRAASAAARAADERRQGVEQQVIFQVFNSFYAVRTATQRVRTSDDLLASATQSEQVALGRYRAGAGSLLDLFLSVGCSRKGAGGPARVPVTVARAEQRAIPFEIAATGTAEPRQTVSVQSQVTGVLTQVTFREGDDVAAGQVLFQIDPRP